MVRVYLPGKTQTMVRANCQNGDVGGSWVGEVSANRVAAINPPIDDTDPILSTSEARRTCKPSRILSKRAADTVDTEFQY